MGPCAEQASAPTCCGAGRVAARAAARASRARRRGSRWRPRRRACRGLREGAERRVALRFEDALGVWPLLLEFFYTGRLEMSEGNAMGLLTAAKQLLVGEVETAARWVLRTGAPPRAAAACRAACVPTQAPLLAQLAALLLCSSAARKHPISQSARSEAVPCLLCVPSFTKGPHSVGGRAQGVHQGAAEQRAQRDPRRRLPPPGGAVRGCGAPGRLHPPSGAG